MERDKLIDGRDLVIALVVLLLLVFGFVALRQFVGWPSKESDWALVVVLAFALAVLPIAGRLLGSLQRSSGKLTLPGGIVFDFSGAVIATPVRLLPDNLVAPGQMINESSLDALDQSARTASERDVIVIDLKSGHAWYLTRLFAVAATAVVLERPRVLVILGQRGGRERRFVGGIRPRDLVNALTTDDDRYAWHWRHAWAYLRALRADEEQPAFNPPTLPRLSLYRTSFAAVGDAAIIRVLVDQMRNPDPAPAPPAPLGSLLVEDQQDPPWVKPSELEHRLDPWLVRDQVDLTLPEHDQLSAILATDADWVAAVREGVFEGLIDVRRAERRILGQLVRQAGVAGERGARRRSS